MDQDTRCPNCGTTKYANANLKIMVNVCGHSLCESCVEQLFVKGAAKCPTCNIMLKRVQFRIQLYDDETVEKDLEIRRRLMKDLSLKEDDFPSLNKYNDYLEMFETFVHNLANDIDVIETNKKIEQFKNENAAKLSKSRNKISKDLALIEQILEDELLEENDRALNKDDEPNLMAQKVAEYKENLIDALVSSDLPAESVINFKMKEAKKEWAIIENNEQIKLQQTRKQKRKEKITSTGIRIGNYDPYLFEERMDTVEEGPQFVYIPMKIEHVGPACPTPRTIQRNNYLENVRRSEIMELAGGFYSIYPCQRALQEAIMDLTFCPKN